MGSPQMPFHGVGHGGTCHGSRPVAMTMILRMTQPGGRSHGGRDNVFSDVEGHPGLFARFPDDPVLSREGLPDGKGGFVDFLEEEMRVGSRSMSRVVISARLIEASPRVMGDPS